MAYVFIVDTLELLISQILIGKVHLLIDNLPQAIVFLKKNMVS